MTSTRVLASHAGTLAQALFDACATGRIDGRVGVLISNNSGSFALERARDAGVPALHISGATHPHRDELDTVICDALTTRSCDLVVLAGYLKKLGPHTLARFGDRVLNVHPALLPQHGGQGMYGRASHAAVAASGDGTTGATVHLVSSEYDRGPVVAQRAVDITGVRDPDQIKAVVRPVERELLVDMVAAFARDGSLSHPQELRHGERMIDRS